MDPAKYQNTLMDTKMKGITRLIVCIYILHLLMAEIGRTGLTVTAWNLRSLTASQTYVQELCQLSDVLFISEHRLYQNELYKLHELQTGFEIYGKAAKDLDNHAQSKMPGHCGIAMMWAKNIAHKVRVIECNSDRIAILEVFNACYNRSIFIIGVYLPQQQCKTTSFTEHLDELSSIIDRHKNEGEILIIGDMNTHFGNEVAKRYHGNSTKNAKLCKDLIDKHELYIVDGDENLCSGPTYTFHVEGVGTSYIDHCIVSELLLDRLLWCSIHEDNKHIRPLTNICRFKCGY